MATKKFYVEYEFPELPSGKMYQNARVEATSIGMACHKAFQVIKARPHVKGRRLHNAKVKVIEAIAVKDE
jgi:hypothetical protein